MATKQIYTSPNIHDGNKFFTEKIDLILEDGKLVDIMRQELPSNTIQLQGVICPAFVNAHCHLELSFLHQKIPAKTGIVAFAQQINELRNNCTEDEIETAIQNAIDSSIKNGIQAVGDICNRIDSFAAKLNSDLLVHNFIEIFGLRSDGVQATKERMQAVYDASNVYFSTSFSPHAPYSLNDKLWQNYHQLWTNPITIHNQESQEEDTYIRSGKGLFRDWFSNFVQEDDLLKPQNISPLNFALDKLGTLEHLLFVHNTFTSKEDILIAQQQVKNRFWVTCPNANLYIENTLPDIYSELQRQNEKICIGTDSLASNHKLSVWSEIHTLNKHKNIPLETLIKWGTSNGAAALKMDNIGKLEIGSDSKVICLEDVVDVGDVREETAVMYL
jgi:aminodeoxyfutalosine deaminase